MRVNAIALLSVAALLATAQQAPSPKDMIGKAAPALIVDKWVNTEKGAALSLEKLRGKVVVVDYWAYW